MVVGGVRWPSRFYLLNASLTVPFTFIEDKTVKGSIKWVVKYGLIAVCWSDFALQFDCRQEGKGFHEVGCEGGEDIEATGRHSGRRSRR